MEETTILYLLGDEVRVRRWGGCVQERKYKRGERRNLKGRVPGGLPM